MIADHAAKGSFWLRFILFFIIAANIFLMFSRFGNVFSPEFHRYRQAHGAR